MLESRTFPSLIKYMGSKTKLIDFVLKGINYCEPQNGVVDLFSGSCTLAGAIGGSLSVHSNDIQAYSKVLAETYTNAFLSSNCPAMEAIISDAKEHQTQLVRAIDFKIDYSKNFSVSELSEIEKKQQNLIDNQFSTEFHYFTKTYSGTWWSAEQCTAIDSLRYVAENYKSSSIYYAILASIMYAMAYSSIGTGHYAQYRDPKTDSNVNDILLYRRKDTFQIFTRKLSELCEWLPKKSNNFNHKSTAKDYLECVKEVSDGSVIYADPPYCFVHYSRFYHALETLLLYDKPDLQIKGGSIVKGRYRTERHQSPFCIKSKVKNAFSDLFEVANAKDLKIALSYSNTGMISIDEVVELAENKLYKPKISVFTKDYKHMTLGRQYDRSRLVKESLIVIK